MSNLTISFKLLNISLWRRWLPNPYPFWWNWSAPEWLNCISLIKNNTDWLYKYYNFVLYFNISVRHRHTNKRTPTQCLSIRTSCHALIMDPQKNKLRYINITSKIYKTGKLMTCKPDVILKEASNETVKATCKGIPSDSSSTLSLSSFWLNKSLIYLGCSR